jgi:hypothetical protein
MKKVKEKLKARLAALLAVAMLFGFSPCGPSAVSAFAAASDYVFKILVEPQYTFYSVYEFHAGMAPVGVTKVQEDVYRYWYYGLDSQDTVNGTEYISASDYDPGSELATVEYDYGGNIISAFIDKSGSVKTINLPAGYEDYRFSSDGFSDGLLRLLSSARSETQPYGSTAFLAPDGTIALDLGKGAFAEYIYSGVSSFSDGYANIYSFNPAGLNGYIDKQGNFYKNKPAVAPAYPNNILYDKIVTSLYGAGDSLKNFKDAAGNDIALPAGYSEAYRYHDGYAWVQKDGKWGIIQLRAAYEIIVTPSAVTLQKGTDYRFAARIEGNNSPDQAVVWSLSGSNSNDTSIITTSGALTIASDETAPELIVKATSIAEPAVYDTATVTVTGNPQPSTTVDSVDVYPGKVELKKSDSFQFSAWVSGENIPSQDVTWSLSGNSSGATVINTTNGALTIAANESASALTVKAVSDLNASAFDTADVIVAQGGGIISGGGNSGGVQTVAAADDGVVRLSYTQSGENVTLVMPDDKINDIIKNSSAVATIDVSKVTNAATVSLPKTALEKFADAGLSTEFILPQGSVSFDTAAVKSLAARATGNSVSVALKPVEQSALNAQQRTAAEKASVYDISVSSNSESIENLGDGRLIVSLPYTLKSGEKASGVTIYTIDEDGNMQKTESVYDADAETVTFTAELVPLYGVAYVAVWENPFGDVGEMDWFYGDVEFVSENGLFSGMSATDFGPNTAMTRGMIVTVLGRFYGADVSAYDDSAFGDVTADRYYAGYVAWAKESGIVNGTGDDRFSPDAEISRQDLAATVMRYADFAGKNFPITLQYSAFEDDFDIADYAKNAVQAMYGGGIMNGRPDDRFDPQGDATRAEVAAVLHRFIERTSK